VMRQFTAVMVPLSDVIVQFLTGTISAASVTVSMKCVCFRRLALQTVFAVMKVKREVFGVSKFEFIIIANR